jgi:Mg2+ and Co2+ transporter CorA
VVDCALYDGGVRIPGSADLDNMQYRIEPRSDPCAWIGLYEPSAEQIGEVADAFNLHPLAVEDAVHAHQRPKLERYATLFLVLKAIVHVDHEQVTAPPTCAMSPTTISDAPTTRSPASTNCSESGMLHRPALPSDGSSPLLWDRQFRGVPGLDYFAP